MFVETLDLRELQRGLEQRVQHMEAGLIGGEPGALDFHAAEATYVDATIRATAPWAPHSSSWVISVGQWWTK